MRIRLRIGALPLLCCMMLLSACGGKSNTAEGSDFAPHAFPPTLTDTDYHQKAWANPSCLLCHEHGLEDAPIVKHEGMPDYLKAASCRTCHVQIEGSTPSK